MYIIHTNIIWYIQYMMHTKQCALRATVTRVSRVGTEKQVNGGNYIDCWRKLA